MATNTLLRSLLFVPGDRPERFAKAIASGADGVIIDLEDAVTAGAKEQARQNVKDFAASNAGLSFWLRINAATTEFFAADVRLCGALTNLAGLLLPKAEDVPSIARLSALGRPIIPIIESATGVLQMAQLAAQPKVERLTFGALDLMLELGVTPDSAAAATLLNDVRCRLLYASHANGLQAPLDTVYADIKNLDGLAGFAAHARDMGCAGMLCLHPQQVPVIHRAFAPSKEQLDWAARVLAQAHASGKNAFMLDGQMVDQPVIAQAERLIALAPR